MSVASRGDVNLILAAQIQHGEEIFPGTLPKALGMQGGIVDLQKRMGFLCCPYKNLIIDGKSAVIRMPYDLDVFLFHGLPHRRS